MMLFAELEVRQMEENKTDNKLDTRPVQEPIGQTSTKKFKLKFTDFAVDNFTATFGVPSKVRVYTPFDVSQSRSYELEYFFLSTCPQPFQQSGP